MWEAHESEHHAIDVVSIDIGMIDDGLFWGLPCVSDPNVLRGYYWQVDGETLSRDVGCSSVGPPVNNMRLFDENTAEVSSCGRIYAQG